jgi:hypothetical protein
MLAICAFKRNIYFATYEMEARRCVEFTGGSRAITLRVAAGILGSTQDMQPRGPCSRHRSPHHQRISRRAVDLVEGGVKQSGAH